VGISVQINQFFVLSAVLLIVTKDDTRDNAMLSYAMIFLYSASGITMLIIAIFEMIEEYKGGSRQLELTDLVNIVNEEINEDVRDSVSSTGEGDDGNRASVGFQAANPMQSAVRKGTNADGQEDPGAKKQKNFAYVEQAVRKRQDTEGNEMMRL